MASHSFVQWDFRALGKLSVLIAPVVALRGKSTRDNDRSKFTTSLL
jgi:hypothetical protein